MSGEPADCQPWPRTVLDADGWRATAARADLFLIALWADTVDAHALYRDADEKILFVTVAVADGAYPAVSTAPGRAGAALFERAARDLWGHAAAGASDVRPWLDHGHWPAHHPMALRPVPVRGPADAPEFLPDDTAPDDEPPMLFTSGPVRGGTVTRGSVGPAHVRLSVSGRGVVRRAEARLGYAHRGVLTLMRGQSPRAAARIAARLSAASTIAHALAFARAAERFLPTPPRAEALRALMLALERIAGHLLVLGCVAGASSPVSEKAPAVAREAVLRACHVAFGHRLMMDRVTPGGVAADIAPDGADAIRGALDVVEACLPMLDRIATVGRGVGTVSGAEAAGVGADGIVARASGLAVGAGDTRISGDVAARSALRAAAIADDVDAARLLLTPLPDGPVAATLEPWTGEGIGMAEGAGGECWHWLRLDGGLIAAAYARDPAWAHWPLFEATATGAAFDDAALIEASFGLTVAGVDL